jgi:hypothetical protein
LRREAVGGLSSPAFFITQSFFAGKWMTETKSARGTPAYFGFLLGGTLGSLAAIFTMKHLCGRF